MRRFVFSEGSSNKFWEVSVDGKKVVTRYGRIGSDGQETVKTESSPDKAQALADKLIREKTGKGYVEEKAQPKQAKPAVAPKTAESRGASGAFTALLDVFPELPLEEGLARLKALGPPANTAPAAERAAWHWIQGLSWTSYPNADSRKAAKHMQDAIDADPDAPPAVRALRFGELATQLGGAKQEAAVATALALAPDDETRAQLLYRRGLDDGRQGIEAALEGLRLVTSSTSLSPKVASELWSHHGRLSFIDLNQKDRKHVDKELTTLGLEVGPPGHVAGYRKALEVARDHAPLSVVLSHASQLMYALGQAGKTDDARVLFDELLPRIIEKAGTELDPLLLSRWFEDYISASGATDKAKQKLEAQSNKLWGKAADLWNARKEAREKAAGAKPKPAAPAEAGDAETFGSLADLHAKYPRWADAEALLANTLKPTDPSPWAKLEPLPKLKHDLDAWRDGIAATAAPMYGTGGKSVVVKLGGTSAKLTGAWPKCGGCDAPLSPLAQIDLGAVAALLPKDQGSGFLSMLFCMSCYPTDQAAADDQSAVAFILAPDTTKDTKRPAGPDDGDEDDDKTVSPQALKLAPGFSFPRWTEAELPDDPADVAVAHLGALVEKYNHELVARHGSMGVGGHPHWDQDAQFPECETCAKPMQLLLQQNDVPYDDAFFFLFICARTRKCAGVKKPAFVIQ